METAVIIFKGQEVCRIHFIKYKRIDAGMLCFWENETEVAMFTSDYSFYILKNAI